MHLKPFDRNAIILVSLLLVTYRTPLLPRNDAMAREHSKIKIKNSFRDSFQVQAAEFTIDDSVATISRQMT